MPGPSKTKSKQKSKSEPEANSRARVPASSGDHAATEILDQAPASAADEVDAQLARYRSMRDFGTTAEPAGAASVASPGKKTTLSGGLPFVIQKHAASHLHYDFRLGWAGVLKSWACAKGPSYVTADRRLAVQVEDHPVEYGGFEGTIPKGQYGGGTVMVWDQGTWWPQPGHENVDAGLRDGSLKFEMNGSRMKGKWTLVRMNPRAGGKYRDSGKPNWLLIKEHDAFERPAGAAAITDEALTSAVTGRTMEQIAQETDHVWNSKETAGTGQAWYRREPGSDVGPSTAGPDGSKTAAPALSVTARPAMPGKKSGAAVQPSKSSVKAQAGKKANTGTASSTESAPQYQPGVKPQDTSGPSAEGAESPTYKLPAKTLKALPKELQPTFIQPQLALETANPPDAAGWLHELKLDGYRIQARKTGDAVALLTRSGLDWTYRVPAVAAAVARLPVENVTLDGEVVVLTPAGTTDFALLQASFQEGARNPLTYFCFDLLHLEGRSLRDLPLRQRKALLAGILSASHDEVRLSDHIDSGGEAVFQKACELHAEGIVSKRASAPYTPGRNGDWLKAKCLHEQEFVIGGFMLSSDGPDRIGSLLLGYYDETSKLLYAGRSGTGFTQKSRRSLRERLASLERKTPPFTHVPTDARRGALWVEPRLVAQVRFASWTAENLLRQAAFLGLREDKAPEEVLREEPTTSPKRKGSGRVRTPVTPAKVDPAEESDGSKRAADSKEQGFGPATMEGKAEQLQPRKETSAQAQGSKSTTTQKRSQGTQTAASRAESASAPTGQFPSTLRLTHPRKILDPETGLTKQELADFYWAVAPQMLPHIAGRPLSLVRCPDGAGKPCFYQKHVNHMLPAGVTSVEITDKKSGKPEPYITLHTAEALAGLAQMGVLEIHPWGSRNLDLEHPDRLIFDLDPDEALDWSVVCAAALEVRTRLTRVGLTSFVKTTGGKGLHIVVPIQPQLAWPEIKVLTQLFVLSMERDFPQRYLTRMTKAARRGKIYLDYLRNERGATAVAPFSPRARLGVNASVPLPWDALNDPVRPAFPVREFASWQHRLRSEPWKKLGVLTQQLLPERIKVL